MRVNCHEWAVTGSNPRPSACKADALPAELTARNVVHGTRGLPESGKTEGSPGAIAADLPGAPGDERAPEPRCAELLRTRQEVLPDAPRRPPRRRALRHLVRRTAGEPGAPHRRESRPLLPASVRRPPRLARRAAERRRRLGRGRGDRRGRVRVRCSEESAPRL